MLTQVISNFQFSATNIINVVAVKAYRGGYTSVTQSEIQEYYVVTDWKRIRSFDVKRNI